MILPPLTLPFCRFSQKVTGQVCQTIVSELGYKRSKKPRGESLRFSACLHGRIEASTRNGASSRQQIQHARPSSGCHARHRTPPRVAPHIRHPVRWTRRAFARDVKSSARVIKKARPPIGGHRAISHFQIRDGGFGGWVALIQLPSFEGADARLAIVLSDNAASALAYSLPLRAKQRNPFEAHSAAIAARLFDGLASNCQREG